MENDNPGLASATAGASALSTTYTDANLALFETEAVKWMTEAEEEHLSRLFYSDEAEKSTNDRVSQAAQNGCATGFVAVGKSFTRALGFRSSDSIRRFFSDLTVCECQGLMHAVLYSALCDVLGANLFDRLFPEIPIGSADFERAICNPRRRTIFPKVGRDDQPVRGDWVYIMTNQLSTFREAVEATGHGAAGSGWNLIYCGNNRYRGFGLNRRGETSAFTLDEIRDKIVADIYDHAPEEEKKAKPALEKKSLAWDDLPIKKSSSSSSSSVASRHNVSQYRKVIRDSIQVVFIRRLDRNALLQWIRLL